MFLNHFPRDIKNSNPLSTNTILLHLWHKYLINISLIPLSCSLYPCCYSFHLYINIVIKKCAIDFWTTWVWTVVSVSMLFFSSINVVPHNLWLVKAKDADPRIVLWRADFVTWAFMDFVICGGFWNQFSVATERQMTFNCVSVFTPTLSRVVEASPVHRYAYIIKYIFAINIWMNFYLLYKLKIRKIRDSYLIFSYS